MPKNAIWFDRTHYQFFHRGGHIYTRGVGHRNAQGGKTERNRGGQRNTRGGHRNTQGRTQKDRGGGWIGIYPYFKPSLGYQPPLPTYPRAFLALAAGIKVITQNAAG